MEMLRTWWEGMGRIVVYAQYCAGKDMQTIVCQRFWTWAAYAMAGFGLLVVVFIAKKFFRERGEANRIAMQRMEAQVDASACVDSGMISPPVSKIEDIVATGQSHDELATRIREALKTRAAAPAPVQPRAKEKADANLDASPQRELMAIMLTDMVGYSASMEFDEKAAYARLLEHNSIIRTSIAHHRGREIKTIGDAFLVVFRSAIDAVDCALSIQRAFKDRNLHKEGAEKILIRIGVHLGDVLITTNDVYGDGVNVVARIEPLAEPGGICVSGEAYAIVRKKLEFDVEQLAGVNLKNINSAPDVYRIHVH